MTNTPAASPLVGRWFHSFTANHEIAWQGQILGEAGPGIFVVQLYEWLMGEPGDQRLVKLDDMLPWHFYDTDADMHVAYRRDRDKRRDSAPQRPS